jgi:pyruvate formate lyase activating enzyme
MNNKRASYYESLEQEKVRCLLCPHYCVIPPDAHGFCRIRKNIDGVLYTLNYGETVTISSDPIEKKPLYHFYPRSDILSLGSNSCNLACDFCQNYSISQIDSRTVRLAPPKLLSLCSKHNVEQVAFTYTEPMTWFEYILDSAKILKEKNIRVVLVSNGYINQKPLLELLPYISAMNIDLKAMSDTFYQKICQGSLQPVLDTIKTVAESCHLEITNLLIPGENDSSEEIDALVDFIASINPDIPLHFSRYFPSYKRTSEPTSPKSMKMAYEKALNKLSYVYLGNVLTNSEADTICPDCKTTLITRKNYNVAVLNLNRDRCSNCGKKIYGLF